jgi:hypothetical protein
MAHLDNGEPSISSQSSVEFPGELRFWAIDNDYRTPMCHGLGSEGVDKLRQELLVELSRPKIWYDESRARPNCHYSSLLSFGNLCSCLKLSRLK